MNETRLHIKGAQIAKKNFSGRQMEYNERGDRTCLVVLGQEQAEQLGYSSIEEMVSELKAMQWKISRFNPRDDEEEPKAFMPVKIVFYENRQSKVYMKTSRNSVLMNEDTIGELDRVDIESIDIIINKHHWTYQSREGFNNEVKSMEAAIIEDEIEARNAPRYDSEPDEVPFC